MFDFLFGRRNASKCKRLLKHVQCRLVLLKNKRCSIVRQLRLDVAELLKLGHSQIAFTRAEQIYKDERIIEVYDLLNHFCEFIMINISYIRRHKDCPNDVSEAISSLIFASARCGDIPELRKVRKLFTERYGQRFVMSALELLPGNLVNSQIRNNLSIRTVVEDVKFKLVNEIFRDCKFYDRSETPLALEYNSEWHQQQVGHSSPVKALVPITPSLEKQEHDDELLNIPDVSKILVRANENVLDFDDIQEFQSPATTTEDIINLQDQRVFLFKSLVLPNELKIMEDIPVVKIFRKTCNRRSKKRFLSKEYRSFIDSSYESYYLNNQRKQSRNNTGCKCHCHSIKVDETDAIFSSKNYSETRMMTPLKKPSRVGNESFPEVKKEMSETEFYSCSECSSWRSVSMANELDEMEKQRHFVRRCSVPVRRLRDENHIHPKLPDYKELETTFLALKNSYLQNKKW